MSFFLSRGGKNVPAEVQRWQYFLRKSGYAQAGKIDADFGTNTETATKFFQVNCGITPTGKVDLRTIERAATFGYVVVDDDYYATRQGDYPKPPTALTSPNSATRNRDFSCFKFLQRPLANRPDAEAMVIQGSCDGAIPDWTEANIVRVEVPQLTFAIGYTGSIRVHRNAAEAIQALFANWEREGLLHLILSYEGCFVPRYKRKHAPPGLGGHTVKKSSDVGSLSNHSFGSAFDINYTDNQLGTEPAACGMRGSVRELVDAATAAGIYWGGFFSNKDGMHFEISELV
jgi:D-alanyl-D-alanine carboxypeptidase/Putative peptidoglycan binding domain